MIRPSVCNGRSSLALSICLSQCELLRVASSALFGLAFGASEILNCSVGNRPTMNIERLVSDEKQT